MQLTGENGSSVELVIAGYQYPRHRPDPSDPIDYDANWLMVHGRVHDGTRAWSFRDPCLTTVEVQALAGWLRDVADGSGDPSIHFIEPSLELRQAAGDGPNVAVAVVFAFGARVQSDRGPDDSMGDTTTIELSVPRDALRSAAADLERSFERFPRR